MPDCSGLVHPSHFLEIPGSSQPQLIPPGRLSIPGVTVAAFASLPEFCRVVVQSTPTSDSEIGIEVWMPLNGWNARFFGTGNGGFGGALDYSQMANALLYGYAAAGTDAGHAATAETDASFALGHPQKIIDFGYRARP